MLSSDKNVATIVELVAELKTYFELKKDYLKVDLVEKVVKLVTALAVAVTLLIITVAVLFYFSMAAVYWMAPFVGQAAAFAIMASFFLLLLVLVLLNKQSWIETPMVRILADILLEESEPNNPRT